MLARDWTPPTHTHSLPKWHTPFLYRFLNYPSISLTNANLLIHFFIAVIHLRTSLSLQVFDYTVSSTAPVSIHLHMQLFATSRRIPKFRNSFLTFKIALRLSICSILLYIIHSLYRPFKSSSNIFTIQIVILLICLICVSLSFYTQKVHKVEYML